MSDNLLSNIVEDLRNKSLAHFQMKYTGWYLLGGPVEVDDNDISYQTDIISDSELSKLVAQMRKPRENESLLLASEQDLESRFVYEIRKKPTNAFSGWITVGRAVNNDVVLRYPTISKLHARFEVETTSFGEPLGYQLIDNQSKGRTVHNGTVLETNQTVPVAIGDVILFGSIRCTVVDATLIWESLR